MVRVKESEEKALAAPGGAGAAERGL